MKLTFKRLLLTLALGIGLIKLGGETNRYVVAHNSGAMPVWVINDEMAASFVGDPDHEPLVKATQYKVLCDIFVIPVLTPEGLEYNEIMSLGDLLVWLGRSAICIAQILVLPWLFVAVYRKVFQTYSH